jgi:dinuclear metal center YbgI/SA1388 family protein
MPVKVKEIQAWLESRFPPDWAEDWDRLGLQLGDSGQAVRRVGISLEATPRTVSWAVQNNLQLMICHHPLFFDPLTSLESNSEPGRTAGLMIKADLSLLVAHTNLDAAPDGVSTALANRLGLTDLFPLEGRSGDYRKLVFFIPIGYEEKIIRVVDTTRAGRIGTYRLCTFKARGEGTFLPETGSHPFRGEQGRLERAPEWRLEILTPKAAVAELVEKIGSIHPYEEMAYDVYPVDNPSADIGLGRVGHFAPSLDRETFIRRLKEDMEVPRVRVSGKIPETIQKTAVCGGSAGQLIFKALSAGVQVLICGEIGYHPVVSIQDQGLAIVEIGHYPSEKWVIPVLGKALKEASLGQGWAIEVLENLEPGDPYYQYF